MVAYTPTIGRSGPARSLGQRGRPRDAGADALALGAFAAGSKFIEKPIASWRMRTREVAESASTGLGQRPLDPRAVDPARRTGRSGRKDGMAVMPESAAIGRIIVRGGSAIESALRARTEYARGQRRPGLREIGQGAHPTRGNEGRHRRMSCPIE